MGGRELSARVCALPGVEACTTTGRSVVVVAAPSTDLRLLKGRVQVVCADIGERRPLEVRAAATPAVPPAFPRPQWAVLARAERPVALATASVLALVAITLLPLDDGPEVHRPIAEVASAPRSQEPAASTGPGSMSYPSASFTRFLPFADAKAAGSGTIPTGLGPPPAATAAAAVPKQEAAKQEAAKQEAAKQEAAKQEAQVSRRLAAASKSASATRTTAGGGNGAPPTPVAAPASPTDAAAPAQIEIPPPPAGAATELPICPITPGSADAASAAAALGADTAGVAPPAADGHKSKEPKGAKPAHAGDSDAGAGAGCNEAQAQRLNASPQSAPAADDHDAVDHRGSGGTEKNERGRGKKDGNPRSAK